MLEKYTNIFLKYPSEQSAIDLLTYSLNKRLHNITYTVGKFAANMFKFSTQILELYSKSCMHLNKHVESFDINNKLLSFKMDESQSKKIILSNRIILIKSNR